MRHDGVVAGKRHVSAARAPDARTRQTARARRIEVAAHGGERGRGAGCGIVGGGVAAASTSSVSTPSAGSARTSNRCIISSLSGRGTTFAALPRLGAVSGGRPVNYGRVLPPPEGGPSQQVLTISLV